MRVSMQDWAGRVLECDLTAAEDVRGMISRGAVRHAPSPSSGFFPAHFAARGRAEVLECVLLLLGGAKERSAMGWTPLHVAAQANRADNARVLCRFGARVDARSDFGGTPLMSACEHGAAETARVLVYAGADVDARNDLGKSCLDYAAVLREPERLVRLLLAAGATRCANPAARAAVRAADLLRRAPLLALLDA